MAQFAVHRNKNRRTQSAFPLLLDVQADLLAELRTRVVVPLTKIGKLTRKPIDRLTPIIEIQDERYMLVTPQLAGISTADLGPEVTNVAEHRPTIIAALDLLITGS